MRPPRRALLAIAMSVSVAACGDDSSVPAGTTADQPEPGGSLVFRLPEVPEDRPIPVEFTCDGTNQAPVVDVQEVPEPAVELALIVDDPDAPRDDPFVHWIVYGISAAPGLVSDGDAALSYGQSDAGSAMWFGPCPPEGDDPHHYRWRLFALGSPLDVDEGVDGRKLEEALSGTVVDTAEWVAFYGRE
jgi:Raf kinase inhibitor-like YbhB/YbcL family protein